MRGCDCRRRVRASCALKGPVGHGMNLSGVGSGSKGLLRSAEETGMEGVEGSNGKIGLFEYGSVSETLYRNYC